MKGAYRNDELQESESFVNGSVRVKALIILPKFVIEQGIQMLRQGLGLLLQPKLFIQPGLPVPLQWLVLPARLKRVELLSGWCAGRRGWGRGGGGVSFLQLKAMLASCWEALL